MSDFHVVVDGLVKTYPGCAAPSVDHVSFSLSQGEMLALLGPSGCGKTTILRMIAGLIEPDAGTISLNGRDISAIPVYQRNIGMVFQSYALFPHMTIAQNIAFGLDARGVGRTERDERVRKALDLVKLSGFGERRVGQLSGGQQQRAAIARSLVIEPALLLFDEPLSNLDAKLRDEMRDEIRDIQRRTGVTAIFVTHDQDEALSMADRLVVMSDGRLEQIGTPGDIFDRPQSDFVARFIGNGNFFSARITGEGVAEIDGLGAIRLAGEAAPGETARLLIRPHRLAPALAGNNAGVNRFSGIVERIVYRGQVQSLTVVCGQHRLQAEIFTHVGYAPQVGESITLTVDPADVTLIRRKTP
ncbi:ABC transporter ATP-binding protein [Brenneria corticis]|uniref:Spermidine/putrescine ABC transporter ATP-binding protein n=1 Tax=Brenneria corticis TaxID=2173106 RepID=A0A2U1U7V3_9GAMM|nr:ABC transporter ATP-binding protein [Brenneria sp. CFCC 11842]PWC17743.1 spermidine/putrescine ABC transporter ATP-binding protein [Brenneria sp. CFCC 11842]